MSEAAPNAPFSHEDTIVNSERDNRSGELLALAEKYNHPLLSLFVFFAVGRLPESGSAQSVPELIKAFEETIGRGTLFGMDDLAGWVANGRYHESPSIQQIVGCTFTKQEAALINSELFHVWQQTRAFALESLQKDPHFKDYDEELRTILLGAPPQMKKQRVFTYPEAQSHAAQRLGFRSLTALRNTLVGLRSQVMVDTQNATQATEEKSQAHAPYGAALMLESAFKRRTFLYSQEDSAWQKPKEVTVQEVINALAELQKKLTEDIFHQAVELAGKVYYLPQKERHNKKVKRMEMITSANLHQVQLIASKYEQRYGVPSIYGFELEMEGERIDLGSSRTDSVSKFLHNGNMSYKRLVGLTDFGDDDIKQIVHDAVDSQSLQPEKMRMLIQLSAKRTMLRNIKSLINSLVRDLIQQQNRPVPVSESKKIRHQAALLSEVATDDKITHWSGYESNPYFAFPVIQTAGYASIQSYIAQRLVLEQPGTYAEEGGFTLNDKGIQDPRELGLLAKIADWLNKFKFEEKKKKIANAIGQSIEELLGSTSHELPSIEESMAGLPLNPLWLFLASQLRILVNPRFIMSCNPLNPFQQAELMKHTEVSTYPSESLTDFERYFFPKQETFDAKKLVTLRANSPIRVGNERVGSDMNASVLRLWLPAHARLCGLEVTAGKKRIPLEHRQDYYLELDQKRGYYRLVFTEKGKSVVQSAGSECQYQAGLLASETPHMVPVFTQHNEHMLKEAIGALDEAGYTQIASNLETSFEQKKELTSVGRMVKKLQQRIVAKAGENTSGFWQQMNTVCIGILKRQVFTTEDIAQAVKKGSRYSFLQQSEFTPLTLAEQVANFPKAEPDGRFVGQCVQSSVLLTLLEQFVFGGKETNFHSGVMQNRFLIPGIGRAYFGVGHQNTRGREGDKRVVHDATAPLASALKDVLNWFAKRQNEDAKAVEQNERKGELRGKADLSWAAEKSPQSQKELLFTEITTFAQEYVDRMVETIKMRGPSTAQGYGQQVPRYIAQTGGLLDRLSKMTQGDVPVLDDENQRSQVIEELVVRSAQWSDMNAAVQKQGLGPTRSARTHNRSQLGPGIEHMGWVAGRLNLLLHRLQNYPV